MLATLAILALASAAVAAPVQRAVAEVSNTTSNVAWYLQNGNAGACGNYSSDADIVVGLPLEFYNVTGVVSPYCGSHIIFTNLANNASVTALVQDASATAGLLSVSVAAWRAVDGDNTMFTKASWRFANSTENEAAYAAASSPVVEATSSYQEPSSSSAAAITSTYVKPSATYVAAKVQATTESSTYSEPSSTWTPAPTTTWAPEPTTTWTPEPTTTWKPTTTSIYQQPTKAASSSGAYSGTATWFTQNGVAGNCGNVNSDSAYIIALETSMYANGAHCGKSVTIWGNGGSIQATVADSCPSCVSSQSIDLSVAAFQALDSLSAGVFPVSWSFN